MISIPCDHPDIEEFIECKSDLERVTKANISVRITDDFMKAVENDEDWYLSFIREETGENIYKVIKAKELFRRFCEMNWDYAEPGMLFWDNIEKWNLLSKDPDFHYGGVNPCAEETLPSGGSCLLGSINLSEFVTTDKEFNFIEFSNAVHTAVIGLNEVLDEGLPLHPLQEQRDSVRDWRQIGLGIFGIADMCIRMSIRYGSPESITLFDQIGFTMANAAVFTSSLLAKISETYPKYNYDAISKSPWFIHNTSDSTKEHVKKYGLHNSQLLTCAPTGTLSTMIRVSGGIEPIFANYYTRKTESLHGHDEYYKVYTPIVKEYMDAHGFKDDSELPDYFVTAQTLDYRDRIKVQSIWQSHIDASISSTINLPNEATIEDVEEIYKLAWKNNLKGVTIYRDGCKRSGILTLDNEEKKESKELKRGMIIVADDNCIGRKRTLHTGCGTLHCEAFFDPSTGKLLETYLSKGSTGGCNSFMVGLSRMISLAARGGVDIYSIIDQLQSCPTCPSYAVRTAVKKDTSSGSCCPIAIGNALLDMHEEIRDLYTAEDEEIDKSESGVTVKAKCPECGGDLVFEGGCNTCKNCGYSKCD